MQQHLRAILLTEIIFQVPDVESIFFFIKTQRSTLICKRSLIFIQSHIGSAKNRQLCLFPKIYPLQSSIQAALECD